MDTKSKVSDNKKEIQYTTLIVSRVPEKLKMEFKLHCVEQGLTMSEVLVVAIRHIVYNNDKILG